MNLTLIATRYAERGWSVFPLASREKTPITPHGFKDATTDATMIKRWWNSKAHNVGIATGAVSGFFVIDVDGDEGMTEWRALSADHEPINTLTAITGGGGLHLLFTWVEQWPINNSPISKNIHVRGNGGYIVAPPSIHPNGTEYRWQDESVAIADAPLWLFELLIGDKRKRSSLPPSVIDAQTSVSSSNNHSTNLSRYVEAALRSAADRVRSAVEGARNDTLNGEAFAVGAFVRDGHIDRATVEYALRSAAQGNGLSDNEIDKTLRSALDSAMTRSNRVIAPSQNGHSALPPASQSSNVQQQADEVATNAAAKSAAAAQGEKPTDDDLAQEWIAAHPDTAHGIGEFRRYASGIWDIVPVGHIETELMKVIRAARPRRIRPSSHLLSSVRKMASVMTYVANDRWDADFDILVCANGTLHIPSLTLRPHNPQDYQTSGVPYAYDPGADCPVFKRVLRERIPDAAELVQEFAGLSLTTNQSYEIALWFFGPRGSGKSTIIEGFQVMLGKRAGLLGLSDIERNRFALTNLPGKTLVISTEQPSNFLGSTHIVNSIISGEQVQVERKFADPVVIYPKAKVLWAMNDLPRLGDSADGILRRVQAIEFPPTIPIRDPKIKDAIKHEGPGILNWALEGLARLQARGGFIIPDRVQQANTEYALRNDIPAVFLDEQCERGVQYEVGATALYQAYRTWCENSGHKPQSSTSLGKEWKRLGFESRKTREGWVYLGIRLRPMSDISIRL